VIVGITVEEKLGAMSPLDDNTGKQLGIFVTGMRDERDEGFLEIG